MEISGEVIGIIYQNEINSYTIAEIYSNESEKIETIVGYMPFIAEGDNLKLTGKFVEHKEYGKQFKVETFEKEIPQSLDALERYLGNGTIKGVGPQTAKKIVKKFAENTIDVIKYDYLELAKIKGISKDKAKEISKCFIENWEIWNIVKFLEKFNIGIENSKKIYDTLGVNAIEKIEENPYILIDLTRGIDFKQIDQMALKLGIESNNAKRIKSGIKYALIQITYNGHSCVLLENLKNYVVNLLNVKFEEVEDCIINLRAKGEIIIEQREEDDEWVYLESFYSTEILIANTIFKLNNSKDYNVIKNFNKEMEEQEKKNEIQLSEKQREAVKCINSNNIVIITGGPGTGKTTIIKTIIDIYKSKNKKVILAAPTGRAAKRMTEMTNNDASTLHKLLEIGKLNDDDILGKKSDYCGTPIEADIVIVDEMSMVDMFLMKYLLVSIYKGTKLVLVGDVDQLASVGPGSILKDLIESEKIKTIHLDKIFRQAAKSKIILNAHRVNEGLGFIKKEEIEGETKEDFFFINEKSQEKILEQIASLCNGRLKKFGNYDFFQNIQVLTPTKKGMLGTKELNKFLQNILNSKDATKSEKEIQGVIFRVGDRIMQCKNNYDIYWEKQNENGVGVFNGEFGIVTDIDEKEKILTIKFDDEKKAVYQFSDLDQIEHSYAITIHKAQRK